jgi:integrase
MRTELTAKFIESLKPKVKGFDVMDSVTHSFGVRVLPPNEGETNGIKSYVLYARFPGSSNATRRLIGRCDRMTLKEARTKAREWLAQIDKGIDPAQEKRERERKAVEEKRAQKANTVGAALKAYLDHKAGLRSIKAVEREMKRELAAWMDLPLNDISRQHVLDVVIPIMEEGHRELARNILALTRRFFAWCVDSGRFGLDHSPCERLKSAALIGPRNERTRTLTDPEIAAYWHAAGKLGYPTGPFFQLLLLSALRRGEVGSARWEELDLRNQLWVIPSERMKNKRAHTVPLRDDMVALFKSLPRFPGPYVFTTKKGETPYQFFSRAKARLDALMRAELEAQSSAFRAFKIHDVRRTVRTKLGSLRVPHEICERVLAHTPDRLVRIYDQHRYDREKLEALQDWQAALQHIIALMPPRPSS